MDKKTSIVVIVVILIVVGAIGYAAYDRTETIVPVIPVVTNPVPTTPPVVTPPTIPVTSPVATSTSTTMITPSDNASIVTLALGERFGVAMGDTLEWSVVFDPTSIVTRVPNIATLRGEQGVYTATAVGTTRMLATGAPICNPGEACPQFRQAVTVTIIVK